MGSWETGRYSRALRHASKINALEINVGIVKSKTHTHPTNKPVDMASLYFWQDQGTKHIPKRETLKPAVEDANYKAITKDIVKSMITGNYNSVLHDAGEDLAKAVRVEIVKLKAPPLKPSTIRQRVNGGTNPLVDTGQLVRAIDYKIS